MRRTNATQLSPPVDAEIRLDALRCDVCGGACGAEGAVVATQATGNGASVFAYCCIPHAREHGWPWLPRQPRKEHRMPPAPFQEAPT